MSVQMTIRVEDQLAEFIDRAAAAGEGTRAELINRAIHREVRRRAALRDAEIYASGVDVEFESDTYIQWATRESARASAEID